MIRSRPVALALALAGGLLGPAAAAAQSGKPAKPLADRERPFFLHALENLFLQLPETIAPPAGKPGGAGRRRGLPTDGLAVFVKQQELVFDILRRHAEKSTDAEVTALLPLYRKQLDEYVGFNAEVQTALADYHRKLALGRRLYSETVLASGIGYAALAIAEGRDTDGVIGRSVAGMVKTAIREGRELDRFTEAEGRAYAADYQRVGDAYEKQLAAARKTFGDQLQVALKAVPANAKNPFRLVADTHAVLKKDGATAADLLDRAKACREAYKMVPYDDAYDVYRTAFLAAGGVLANAAAARDCGATGIPVGTAVPAAGYAARDFWDDYLKLEYNSRRQTRRDFTDDFFQAYLLGHAYAGDFADPAKRKKLAAVLFEPTAIVKSYRANKSRKGPPVFYTLRTEFSDRPDFWFDCGRLASLLGDTPLAFECLKAAVAVGFRDGAEVRTCLDLRNLREDGGLSADFARLFPK